MWVLGHVFTYIIQYLSHHCKTNLNSIQVSHLVLWPYSSIANPLSHCFKLYYYVYKHNGVTTLYNIIPF